MTSARRLVIASVFFFFCFPVFVFVSGFGLSEADAQPRADDVGDQVAASLYDRGMVLFEEGDIANAKKMFGESLERSPDGSQAADALRMLRQCNEKLGIQDLDAGRPSRQPDGPLDPYGEGPLDPYADPDGPGGEAPLDPYADPTKVDPNVGDGPGPKDKSASRAGRLFVAHGALQGFMSGMALLGPYEVDANSEALGSLRGGAVALGLVGAGAAGYLSYWLTDNKSLTETQGNVINSGGLWGTYNGAHIGNLFAGDTSDANDIYLGMAITGVLGSGLGYWYAKEKNPSAGDLAFTNSLTLYGTAGGLLIGVAMDPPRGDAYSLNALLGSALGLGLGYYAKGYKPTRKRMFKVDLGAAVGAAAPWILFYPLVSDSSSHGDEQLTGFLSAVGLAGGGYLTWRYTDGDSESDGGDSGAPLDTAPPALVRRSEGGSWSLSSPTLRPMPLPDLAPQRGLSFGTDLLSGHF